MLRVRFIGTSSGDYEFKPYDLIGEVILKNVHTPYITYDCNIFANLVFGKIGSWKFNDCLTSRAGGLISNTPELGGQSASSWGQMEINVLYILYNVLYSVLYFCFHKYFQEWMKNFIFCEFSIYQMWRQSNCHVAKMFILMLMVGNRLELSVAQMLPVTTTSPLKAET